MPKTQHYHYQDHHPNMNWKTCKGAYKPDEANKLKYIRYESHASAPLVIIVMVHTITQLTHIVKLKMCKYTQKGLQFSLRLNGAFS